jgi:tRNA pseudouridine38-40 synthase
MRYFFHISFKGTHFSGWQRQRDGVVSVQEVLEYALLKVTGKPISVMGCGRTDSGVHASQFFAHFDADSEPDIKKLNFTLPDSIVVHDILVVPNDAHARYDATSRTYTFLFHTLKNPYSSELSTYLNTPIIYKDKMIEACQWVRSTQDFRGFCKTPKRHNTTICEIQGCTWDFSGDTRFIFTITANRFLKSMVRILAQDFIELGIGAISSDEFKNRLAGNRIGQIHKIAYPQGLYLSNLSYKSGVFEKAIVPLIIPG